MNILTILKEKSSYNNVEVLDNENKLISFLNPYSYLLFRKNIHVFSKFDIIYIDGILLVKLLKIISLNVPRCSFDMTSLAPKVFKNAIESNKSIYFVGSKKDEISNFIKTIKLSFPELNICGFRNGYFNYNEKELEIKSIVKINPEIVICGMGTPFQEEFLILLRENGWKGTGYTCGGFFHQTSKGISYYPEIFNKLHLRWLFRIIDEPKLFSRYFIYYPKSIVIYIFDVFRYILKRK